MVTPSAVNGQKLERARFIASQLATVPFVRLIALGNSVAMGTATEMSDLDFFVVTAPNRLWTTRSLLLLKAKRLGLAKRPGQTANQADFGFWIDETALDLSPIALEDDPYLSRWLVTLIPLVDRGGVYERLMSANTEIATVSDQSGPRNDKTMDSSLRVPSVLADRTKQSFFERLFGSFLGEPLERLLFWIQRWKVWAEPITHHPSPLTVRGRRVDVVTTRHMLKLHHFDQRAKYRDQQRAAAHQLD